MPGIDQQIAHLGNGAGVALALITGLLLGLRHATDPDHLTAVSTLVMGDGRTGRRRAGALGFSWGLGHATTLLIFGIPVVLFHDVLPETAQHAAEVGIGILITVLAIRLLVRWRRGYFHVHPHEHGGRWHAHPHVHEHAPEAPHPAPHRHDHKHAESLGRSPLAAYGIGVMHGLGGSAGAGLLVVGAIPGRGAAAGALVMLAGGAAISMALLSSLFGGVLGRAQVQRGIERLAPGVGVVALGFGVWYALEAATLVPSIV